MLSMFSEETPEAKGAHWRAVLERLSLEVPGAVVPAATPYKSLDLSAYEEQEVAYRRVCAEREALSREVTQAQEERAQVRRLLADRGLPGCKATTVYNQVQGALGALLALREDYNKLLAEHGAHQDAIDLLEKALREAQERDTLLCKEVAKPHQQLRNEHERSSALQQQVEILRAHGPARKRPSARRK
jgi:ribonuclease D